MGQHHVTKTGPRGGRRAPRRACMCLSARLGPSNEAPCQRGARRTYCVLGNAAKSPHGHRSPGDVCIRRPVGGNRGAWLPLWDLIAGCCLLLARRPPARPSMAKGAPCVLVEQADAARLLSAGEGTQALPAYTVHAYLLCTVYAGSPESISAFTQASFDTNKPPPSISHAFLGSRPATYSHGIPASQQSVSPRQRSRSRSRSRSRTAAVHIHQATDQNDIIYRENPDKRGLATRDGRNVNKSSSREEVERRVAREKIKERVKRANELEEKKERELVEEGNKKKKPRGFLCGLFAKA